MHEQEIKAKEKRVHELEEFYKNQELELKK
jgi:hypothetical protein